MGARDRCSTVRDRREPRSRRSWLQAHTPRCGASSIPTPSVPFRRFDDVGDECERVVALTVPAQHRNLQGRLVCAERRERRRLSRQALVVCIPDFHDDAAIVGARECVQPAVSAANVERRGRGGFDARELRYLVDHLLEQRSGEGPVRRDGKSRATLRAATRRRCLGWYSTRAAAAPARRASTRPRVGGA